MFLALIEYKRVPGSCQKWMNEHEMRFKLVSFMKLIVGPVYNRLLLFWWNEQKLELQLGTFGIKLGYNSEN